MVRSRRINPSAIRHFFGIPAFEDAAAAIAARRLYLAALAGLALTLIDYGMAVVFQAHQSAPGLLLVILIMLAIGTALLFIRRARVDAARQIFLIGCWGIVAVAILLTQASDDWFAPLTGLLFVTLGLWSADRIPVSLTALPTNTHLIDPTVSESEKRYRVISELISDYAYAYDVKPDGSITPNWITDNSFTRLTGYSWQEIGASFNLYHPDDMARAQADVQRTLRGESVTGEYRIITRSGQICWIYMRRRPEWSADGQRVIRFYGAAQDVTNKHEAEEALRLSERRYRVLTANLPDSVVILFDQDMRFVLVDGPEVERTGYSKAKMEGKTLYEALPPEFVQIVEPNMRAVLNGQKFSAEIPFGDEIYAYSYIPLSYDGDQINLGMILGQNITLRKQAEAALRKAEAANRTLSERLKALFATTLELSKVDNLDELCRRAIELGHSQLKFDRLGLWLVSEDRQSLVGTFGIDEHGNVRDERNHFSEIAPIFYVLSEISREGARVYFQEDQDLYNDQSQVIGRGWIAMGTLLDGELPIGTLSADNLLSGEPIEPYQLELLALYTSHLGNLITRKRTEIALRDSEEKFRTIFNLAPYGITIQQKGGVFIDANRAFLSSLGYASEDVRGKSILELGLIRDETIIEN